MQTRSALVASIVWSACASARVPSSPDAGNPSAIDAGGTADAAVSPTPSTCPGASALDVTAWPGAWNVNQPRVTWRDGRYAVIFTGGPDPTTPHPYFAFVDASGAAASGSPQPLSTDFGAQPRLAWSGTEYGVAWHTGATDVHFARVDAGGALIAGSERAITTDPGDQVSAAIAWDPVDAQWGVAYLDQGTSAPWHVVFVRVGSGGDVIAGSRVVVDGGAGGMLSDRGNPLVWNGHRFAVAWTNDDAVHVAEIDANGAITTPVTIATSLDHAPSQAALVADGTGYGLAWIASELSSPTVQFARSSASGVVTVSDTAELADAPAIVWTGTEYGLTWFEYASTADAPPEVWMARLDPSGALIAGSRRAVSCGPEDLFPDLAWSGTGYAITYASKRASGWEGHTILAPGATPQ